MKNPAITVLLASICATMALNCEQGYVWGDRYGSGSVKLCKLASDVCYPYEIGENDICKSCPKGFVRTKDSQTGCSVCPAGTVRGDRYGQGTGTGGTCKSASSICFPYEYGEGGQCVSCQTGAVSTNGTKDGCALCADGTVRGDRYGQGTGAGGICKSASTICFPYEYGEVGKCVSCQTGAVSTNGMKAGCTLCPDGFVRGDRYGQGSGATATCLPAFKICYPYEYGEDGRCKSCSTGQTTSNICAFCPVGQVRGDRYGQGTGNEGYCKAATSLCFPYEFGINGTCRSCPTGAICTNGTEAGCTICPGGTVRGDRYGQGTGTGGTCKSASTTCFPYEYGEGGKCVSCQTGEVCTNGTKAGCTLCADGFVRGDRYGQGTGTGGTCKWANITCFPYEYGEGGKCVSCQTGAVSPDGTKTGCGLCPAGYVRGDRYGQGTGTGGTCKAAGSICKDTEIGKDGVCKACSAGTVPDDDHSECI